MKRLALLPLLLLAVVGLAGCPNTPVITPTTPVANPDWTITTTFNYDFTNFAPCSASVTKGCITGFTWGFLQGAVQVPLRTSPPAVCTGSTQPETCTDTANSQLGIGTVTFYAVANGLDNSGNPVSSTADNSAGVPISIAAPTGAIFAAK